MSLDTRANTGLWPNPNNFAWLLMFGNTKRRLYLLSLRGCRPVTEKKKPGSRESSSSKLMYGSPSDAMEHSKPMYSIGSAVMSETFVVSESEANDCLPAYTDGSRVKCFSFSSFDSSRHVIRLPESNSELMQIPFAKLKLERLGKTFRRSRSIAVLVVSS